MTDASHEHLHFQRHDRIGSYEVREQVGGGGTSIVYRGQDTVLDRRVALKQVVAALDDEDLQAAVDREVEAHKQAARRDTQHILQIIEVVHSDRGPVIVTEWVDGPSLEKILHLQASPMPVRQALGIVAGAALGLKSIHAAGLIHRDLKPANILMPRAGGLKLADFGLAGALADEATLSAGSARYLAPEVLRGEAADARSDLYSLGIIAYEMLAGRDHFNQAFRSVLRDERHTAMRWLKWHTNPRTAAPSLKSLVPEIPDEVNDLVARLMDKDPVKRVANADELLAAIRRGATTAAAPSADDAEQPSGQAAPGAAASRTAEGSAVGDATAGDTAKLPTGRRWPALAAIVVGLAVVVGAVLVFENIQERRAEREQRAQQARSHFRDGRQALQRDNFDTAIASFEDVLEIAPEGSRLAAEARAYSLIAEARALDADDQHAAALEKYEQAQALGVVNRDRIREWIRSSEAGLDFDRIATSVERQVREGRFDAAFTQLQELEDMTALTAAEKARVEQLGTMLEDRRVRQQRRELLEEANRLAQQGARQAAIDMLERQQERSPHHEIGAAIDRLQREQTLEQAGQRARQALDNDDLEAAVDALQQMQRLEPDDRRAQRIDELRSRIALQQARQLMSEDRHEQAEVKLLESLELDENPQARELLENMGEAKRRAALIRAGDQAMSERDYDQAIGQYRAALDLDESPELRDKLREARLRQSIDRAEQDLDAGEIAAARDAVERAAGIDASDPRVNDLQDRIETRGRYLDLLDQADAAREQSDFGRAKRLYIDARDVIDTPEVRERIDLVDYQHLVAQARSAMAAERDAAARALLLSAADIKRTDEVIDLLNEIPIEGDGG